MCYISVDKFIKDYNKVSEGLTPTKFDIEIKQTLFAGASDIDEVHYFNDLEQKINQNTKALIVNSPNNPSGVVYTEETIKTLCDLLNKKQKEYNHPIFFICLQINFCIQTFSNNFLE